MILPADCCSTLLDQSIAQKGARPHYENVTLLQDLLAVSLGCPDDRIGIVVYNDGDVFVTLPVAGLINTDVDQVIKTCFGHWIRGVHGYPG